MSCFVPVEFVFCVTFRSVKFCSVSCFGVVTLLRSVSHFDDAESCWSASCFDPVKFLFCVVLASIVWNYTLCRASVL